MLTPGGPRVSLPRGVLERAAMSSEPPVASTLREAPRDAGLVVTWDAVLARRSPLFAPLEDAIDALTASMPGDASFPQPEIIDAALGARAGIRFERQRPVSRRRRQPRDPSSMYDARIAREGCVPTRPGSWHDLMNALVWATFPRAKRTLHARQHRLVVPAAPGESARRPRELDALALLDEGGLVVSGRASLAEAGEEELAQAIASGDATAFVFGHAIYEGLVLGRPSPLASVVCVEAGEAREAGGQGEPVTRSSRAALAAADAALEAVIADPLRIVDPRTMRRLRVDPSLAPAGRG